MGFSEYVPQVECLCQPTSQTPFLADTEQQLLQDLMREAMEETEGQHAPGPQQNGKRLPHGFSSSTQTPPNSILLISAGGREEQNQEHDPPCSDLFLFPDESGNLTQDSSPTYPVLHSPLITPVPNLAQEADDFCILETPGSRQEVGMVTFMTHTKESRCVCCHVCPLQDLDQEPVVKQLTSDPVEIKDDHFSLPLCGSDSSPGTLNFPIPEVRYLIKEISMVWHLYGGKDFRSATLTASPSKSQG